MPKINQPLKLNIRAYLISPKTFKGIPMARAIIPLTATQIKQAKPKEKDYKLSDGGGGLYLQVTKAGGKYWKLKYKLDNKESKISLGICYFTRLTQIFERSRLEHKSTEITSRYYLKFGKVNQNDIRNQLETLSA